MRSTQVCRGIRGIRDERGRQHETKKIAENKENIHECHCEYALIASDSLAGRRTTPIAGVSVSPISGNAKRKIKLLISAANMVSTRLATIRLRNGASLAVAEVPFAAVAAGALAAVTEDAPPAT